MWRGVPPRGWGDGGVWAQRRKADDSGRALKQPCAYYSEGLSLISAIDFPLQGCFDEGGGAHGQDHKTEAFNV